MKLKDLLKKYYATNNAWYWPRAFWPYIKRPDGIPGFHIFMQLQAELAQLPSHKRKDEEVLLDKLRTEGAMGSELDEAEDYHVHY